MLCRYVNPDGSTDTVLLNDFEIADGTANTITAAITSELQIRQLDVTQMSTLSADGASTFSGCKSGVGCQLRRLSLGHWYYVLLSRELTRLLAFQCWQNLVKHLTHCMSTISTVLDTMPICARFRQHLENPFSRWRRQSITGGYPTSKRFLPQRDHNIGNSIQFYSCSICTW